MNRDEILNEMLSLYPELRENEAQLKEAIDKLLRYRPDSEPDESFRERLKGELLALIPAAAEKKRKILFFRRSPAFTGIGIGAAALLAIAVGLRVLMPGGTGTGYADQAAAPIPQVTMTQNEPAQPETKTESTTETRSIASAGDSSPPPQASAPAEQPSMEKSIQQPSPLARKQAAPSAALRSAAPSPGIAYDEQAPMDGFFFAEAEEAEADISALAGAGAPADDLRDAEVQTGAADTEEYARLAENPLVNAQDKPVSTFSIDVDTASYSNVRRFLTYGELPQPEAVRIEELVNYFSYDYPQPAGDLPFSFTAQTIPCPWDDEKLLMRIGIQGKMVATEDLPPSNLVFLIDASGSMSDENKLPLLKESLALLAGNLREQDRISLVAYAGAAGLVLPPTPGNRSDEILAAMDRISAGGSTAGGEGIELAYRTAAENFIPGGNNRIILATDGDFNVGPASSEELEKLIEEKRKSGIYLTVLGLGMGNYKDSRMETLADKGNGNYAYIDTLKEARKVLVTEMSGTLLTIAKDVKIQVEFDPAAVKSYRLVGYENRMLENRDFADDTKDAGEVGAGHSVTALYELIPAGETEGWSPGEIRFRYKAPDEDQSRLVTSPLSGTVIPTEKAPGDFLFAAAVAEWGLILRQSELLGDSVTAAERLDRIRETVRKTLGQDIYGYRREFLEMVGQTAALLNQ